MKGRRGKDNGTQFYAEAGTQVSRINNRAHCAATLITLCLLVLQAGCGGERTYLPLEGPQGLGTIQHIVVIIKENHSFDNYFGTFPGADGATSGKLSTGQVIPLGPTPDLVTHGIELGWEASLLAIDGGKMDKFDLTPGANVNGDYVAYTQLHEQGIPNYFQYARNFVLADHMFTSIYGPTFPNRLYSIAAQSGGVISNPENATTWGCDAAATATVQVFHNIFLTTNEFPCFDFQTLPDELEAAGITWKFYSLSPDDAGYIFTTPDAIRHFRYSSLWTDHVLPASQFITDAQNGNLPAVSWVMPGFSTSEHPTTSICVGENWTVEQINALMEGPEWNSSAIFVTYDESGGFYDHVPPPAVDPFGLSVRIPLLIISPFAKRGHISHTTYSMASILRFVEARFDLRPLTDRDDAANDLLDSFDFNQQPLPPLVLLPRQCQ